MGSIGGLYHVRCTRKCPLGLWRRSWKRSPGNSAGTAGTTPPRKSRSGTPSQAGRRRRRNSSRRSGSPAPADEQQLACGPVAVRTVCGEPGGKRRRKVDHAPGPGLGRAEKPVPVLVLVHRARGRIDPVPRAAGSVLARNVQVAAPHSAHLAPPHSGEQRHQHHQRLLRRQAAADLEHRARPRRSPRRGPPHTAGTGPHRPPGWTAPDPAPGTTAATTHPPSALAPPDGPDTTGPAPPAHRRTAAPPACPRTRTSPDTARPPHATAPVPRAHCAPRRGSKVTGSMKPPAALTGPCATGPRRRPCLTRPPR